MPKEKNKTTLLIIVALITFLIGTIVFVIINPTDNPTITKTKEKILPFGKPTPIDPNIPVEPIGDDSSYDYDTDSSQDTQKLTLIVSEPVAGARFITGVDGKTTVRYVEQKTGDVYEYSLATKTSERILQQTLLGVRSALWTKSGENVVLRFLKEEDDDLIIKTYAVPLKNVLSASSTASVGKFLPDDLPEIVVSRTDTEQVIYLQKNKGDSFIMSENLDNVGERQQLFASPFSEWLVEWVKDGLVVLTTKPSYDIEGYSYFVNTENGTIKKILGKIKGLTVLTNPDATKLLYAKSGKNVFDLVVYDIETKTETVLELNTFPEKCVWGIENANLLYCAASNFSDNNNLPDDWYKGKVSFFDEIWIINTETEKTGVLTSLKKFAKDGIDVTGISLSPEEDRLLFTNKKDSALWMLKLDSIGEEEEDNNLPSDTETNENE